MNKVETELLLLVMFVRNDCPLWDYSPFCWYFHLTILTTERLSFSFDKSKIGSCSLDNSDFWVFSEE